MLSSRSPCSSRLCGEYSSVVSLPRRILYAKLCGHAFVIIMALRTSSRGRACAATYAAEEPLTGRARCLSDIARSGAGNVHARVAKSDPRAPRRRSRSQQCIFALDYGKLWASGTTDREDAIPPSAGSVGCYAAEGRHAS
jgi:hypothetical protein